MKNKIVVSVAGREYTLIATEEGAYVHKVAAYVDAKVKDIIGETHVSVTDGAVLAAINIADDYYKALDSAENLRRQLKDYFEETSRTKMELAETRRELTRLKGNN